MLSINALYFKTDCLSVVECLITHNESLWTTGYPTFAGVSVGSSEDVPEFRNDGLLSEGMVVLGAEGKVANETHESLAGGSGKCGEIGESKWEGACVPKLMPYANSITETLICR